MNEKPLYQRGHKMYLDKAQTKESEANGYFECRDGIVKSVTYHDMSGYGTLTRLLYCRNAKHESCAIIRQTCSGHDEWEEESWFFDSDSFEFLLSLLGNDMERFRVAGGRFETLRDYMSE